MAEKSREDIIEEKSREEKIKEIFNVFDKKMVRNLGWVPNPCSLGEIDEKLFIETINSYIDFVLGSKKFDIKTLPEDKYKDFLFTIVNTNYFQQTYYDKFKEKESNQGEWIKYERGSDPSKLASLLGTVDRYADSERIRPFLKKGDYYVYCTKNDYGEFAIPRASIVMRGSHVFFISPFLNDKNIEKSMEDVIEKKLKEFPDGIRFEKKLKGMKKITSIYKKQKKNEELSIDELRYLYDRIDMINYFYDPRLDELKRDRMRCVFSDLGKIYNCEKSQIELFSKKVTKDTVYCGLDLYYRDRTSAKDLILPQNMGGTLNLENLISAEGLVLPKHIGGDLYLNSLTSAKDLVLPEFLGGNLFLNSLTSAKGLVLPKYFYGYLVLSSLTSAEGLVLPEYLSSLNLCSLKSAKGLVLPKVIEYGLDLSGLTNADNLVLPEYVSQVVDLRNVKSANRLVLPKFVGNILDLSSLDSLDGLIFPENFDYNIKTKFGIINKDNISEFIDVSKKKNGGGSLKM